MTSLLWLPLPSDETILSSIFCASGLLVINFLSLFLSWNTSILFYLTDSFAGYSGSAVVVFQGLECVSPYPNGVRNSCQMIRCRSGGPPEATRSFSFAASKVCSLACGFSVLTVICCGKFSLLVFSLWRSAGFLYLDDIFFHYV